MRRPAALLLKLLLAAAAAGCSLIPASGPPGEEVPNPSTLPVASVVFNLTPPAGTPAEAQVALVLLDDVTGVIYNPVAYPMQRLGDGRYQAQIAPPVGSLLRYRYTRIAPGPVDEITALGEPVHARVIHVPGPIQFDDQAVAWADGAYSGPTGRVIGRLIGASSGEALPEILVHAGGRTVYSDGEAAFRIDGLPPGVHTVTAFSPDGAYRSAQQGAVVAADSATPAEMRMEPAARVRVVFEITLPEGTPAGVTLRMAGNTSAFGHLFQALPGGVSAAAATLPTPTMVDGTHALLITELYAGTDLRYKYTLGDGLWNAERSADGHFFTRQLIVPDQETLVRDQILSWQSGTGGPVTFRVRTPQATPPEDTPVMQFNPFAWFPPLPMARGADGGWTFTLFGPLDFGPTVRYRYCRSIECGAADNQRSAGPDPVGRTVALAPEAAAVDDVVEAWRWWGADLPPTVVVAPVISARPEFEAGLELLPAYQPGWLPAVRHTLAALSAAGGNAVVFTPGWVLRENAPYPRLAFDPARSPYRADLLGLTAEARRLGLRVVIRPTVLAPSQGADAWWATAPRDGAWWTVWFETYRSFVLTQARLAAEAGADKIVLGGPEITPALPGGRLADGQPSGVPAEAELRWRELIEAVRATFGGRVAFEIELGQSLQPPPAFLEAVDEVHVYWHPPLAAGEDPSAEDLQAAAGRLFNDSLLAVPVLAARPLVLSVEYLSVAGAAAACPPAPGGGCLPAEAFDRGAEPGPGLALDLDEQTRAFNAVLAEAYSRSNVVGFYARRYNPAAALQDLSASLNGKPAREVLWYWYPRITGR